MPTYLRYISSANEPVTLDTLADALDADTLSVDATARGADSGELKLGDTVVGEIEISRVGDANFDDDMQQYVEAIQDRPNGKGKAQVLRLLSSARVEVIVRMFLEGADDDEETRSRIRPLWEWLFANRKGLLLADGEGYYEGEKLVLTEEV